MNEKNLATLMLIITDGNIEHPSSRIRALQYFPFLQKSGFDVKWLPRIPSRSSNSITSRICFAIVKRFFLLRIYFYVALSGYKILFIQRFFIPHWLLQYVRKKARKVIFDFDDAIYISEIDISAQEKTLASLQLADLIITSCPILFNYSRKYNPETIIITSPVDANKIIPVEQSSEIITIGWIGSKWTSKYLDLLTPVLNRLANKFRFRLLLVGASKNLKFMGEIESVEWSLENEISYLQQMDIGLMPLFDSEFERAKGGYKLLQYMAAGKPILASPVGINKEIVVHSENGFLCTDENDWYNYLSLLIENRDLRIEMGTRGRKLILEKYSLEVCAQKLIENLLKL